jgi:hypothetical protein
MLRVYRGVVEISPRHVSCELAVEGLLLSDRELAFYGAEDLTPSDFYKKPDAVAARDCARFVVAAVRPHID